MCARSICWLCLVLVPALATFCAGAENVIINGEFDEGLDPWGMSAGDGYTMEVVQGAGLSGPNALSIDITDATAQDYIMVAQGDLVFESGEVYPIGFMAKAEADRQMRVVLQQVDTWIDLWQGMVNLSTEAKTYTFEYTHNREHMEQVAFYFILRNPWFPVPGEDENIGVYVDQVHVGEPPRANPNIAYDPYPADGAQGVLTPLFQWTAGDTAMWHDLYLGTTPDLGPADLVTQYPAATTVHWHGPGLMPGTTYYWRVDEVEADGVTIHTGDVWSFTAAQLKADLPQPVDGAKWLDPNGIILAWTAGATAQKHDVYFSTSEADVAARAAAAFIRNQTDATYDPGVLQPGTTYYWAIDEYDAAGKKYPGDVWTFSTQGPGGGIKGYYFDNMDLTKLALDRVDELIDFSWGEDSPDPSIDPDTFSVRWIGEVEAAFTEPYTFYTSTDDGVKLWINDEPVISAWFDQGITEHKSEPIELVAGQRYPIKMEYYENGGGATCQLLWSSPSTAKQIIPQGALSPPLKAIDPKPAEGATDVKETPTLRWTAGDKAAQHDVYFGTDPDAVAAADTGTADIYRGRQDLDATSYVPTEAPLQWGVTYYWRIDEVNGVDLWKGSLWSFTTANFIVVDDFEDYDDYCNRIFYTWIDGFGHSGSPDCGVAASTGNGTRSTVGNLGAPFAEQNIVHGGGQSMPFQYDNSRTPFYSETERQWTEPQDWTRGDGKALTLWFYGDPGNAADTLYVVVEDSATNATVVTHPDPEALQGAGWQEWNIALSQFTGVDVAAVKKLYIGVGNRVSPEAGGTGKLYFDDIRVYPPRCIPSLAKPDGDLSGNCIVDYADVRIVADQWLDSGFVVTPTDPGTASLVAHYPLNGNANDVVGGHNGTTSGIVSYGAGKIGQAIVLDGVDDYVVAGSVGISGAAPRTISGWAKASATVMPDWIDVFGFTGPSELADEHFDIEHVNFGGRRGYGIHVYGWERVILPVDLDWHHLAASYDGTTIKWYGDGRLIGSDSSRVLNTPDNVHMGKRADNQNYFPGRVDGVRIFNRALSDAEVAWLAGHTSPLSIPADMNLDDVIDFKDFAVLADSWPEEILWP